MPFTAGIKGRDTDQPVDSVFSFQIAIGIFAGRRKCGALNPGLLTGLIINDVYLKTVSLRPSDIHAKQHFRPILSFGAAGPGIDGDNGIFVIVFPAQNKIQREFSDPGIQLADLSFDLLDRIGVVFLLGQFEQYSGIFQFPGQGGEPVDNTRNTGPFLEQQFGIFRVIPETILGDQLFDFFQPLFFAGQVKDNLPAGSAWFRIYLKFV